MKNQKMHKIGQILAHQKSERFFSVFVMLENSEEFSDTGNSTNFLVPKTGGFQA